MICLQMTGEGKHAAYEYRCNDCGETFEQRKSIAARHGEAEVPEVRKRRFESVLRLLRQDVEEELKLPPASCC